MRTAALEEGHEVVKTPSQSMRRSHAKIRPETAIFPCSEAQPLLVLARWVAVQAPAGSVHNLSTNMQAGTKTPSHNPERNSDMGIYEDPAKSLFSFGHDLRDLEAGMTL